MRNDIQGMGKSVSHVGGKEVGAADEAHNSLVVYLADAVLCYLDIELSDLVLRCGQGYVGCPS